MASRAQQDTFIDDSDEQCPLCVEEFDLSDKNFRPCPCGYQVCQFCFNNIRTNMNGLCPACRRPYDEKTIEFKTVSPEEFKADMALKARKQVTAKQKEAEKRQNETLSRKNLAGLRVVQKNLVYVVGLPLSSRQKEDELLKTLRGTEYFGQYGKIIKIVVSKAKEGASSNSVGVYVTFARKEDAASCIAAVDGSENGDRVLRAQYGTTKYCSAFLRNEQCNNRNCMFLHETGEDSDSFSRQDLSSLNAAQQPPQPGPSQPSQSQSQGPPQQVPQPVAAASQPMHRQGSKDEAISRTTSTDASALPSSASWANKDAQASLNRRASLAASRSSPSPRTGNASIASQKSEESKRDDGASSKAKEIQPPQQPSTSSESGLSESSSRKSSVDQADRATVLLNRLINDIQSGDFKFVFSNTALGPEELKLLEDHPCFIDLYGGVKRHVKKEKEDAIRIKEDEERAKQEAEAQNIQQATAMVEDENLEGGSLQLGGEPEERHDPRSATGRMSEPQSAIQPPSQHGLVGSPLSFNQSFSGLSINGRSLTPQQLMMLKASNSQSAMDQFQPFGGNGLDHGESNRLFQHQMPQVGAQGHARHSSRFSFAGESSSKNTTSRMMGPQSSMMQSNPLATGNTQQTPLGNHMYGSGIQHPPPGLKTAGTPPISGGGMFGQGHGFTSASNPLGIGGNFNNKDANTDLMRELQQGRGNVGGHGLGQSHDTSKREYTFSSSYRFPSPSLSQAPALGLLGSFHGSQPGPYHELGQLKQKKKGKKHRHANTSSFGGGVVDLADPSILRARTHQGGAGAGQGLYGGQGQGLQSILAKVDTDFPPLVPPSKPSISQTRSIPIVTSQSRLAQEDRRSTPPIPPGLGHGHPAPGSVGDSRPSSRSATPAQTKKGTGITSTSIAPAVPILPIGPTRVSSASAPAKQSHGFDPKSVPAAKGHAKDEESTRVHTTQDPGEDGSESLRFKSGVVGRDEKSTDVSETLKDDQDQRSPIMKEIIAAGEKPPKPVPGKLRIPDGSRENGKDFKLEEVGAESGQPTAVPTPFGVETPVTAASRSSDSPAPRPPPRTLRVLPTPKNDAVPLPSAAAQVPPASSSSTQTAAPSTAVPKLKQRSRQPSLTSVSGAPMSGTVTLVAETIGETSDNVSSTPASLSRPTSPPPSIVGSAPTRHVTKSQAKKERKAKAKVAEDAKKAEDAAAKEADGYENVADAATPAATEEVVQEPIIGRKKKAKRAPVTASASTSSTPVVEETTKTFEELTPVGHGSGQNIDAATADMSRPSTPGQELEEGEYVEEAMPTDEELLRYIEENPSFMDSEDEREAEKWEKGVPKDYNDIYDPLPIEFPSEKRATELIQEMIEDGTIRRDHPFFQSPRPLSHRFDVQQGDYEEAMLAANSVTDAQRRDFREGKAVRIRTESGKQMGRALVTPKGVIYRGFTDAEEDHILDLEERISETPNHLRFHPSMTSRLLQAALPDLPPSSVPSTLDDFTLNALGYSSTVPRVPQPNEDPSDDFPDLNFGAFLGSGVNVEDIDREVVDTKQRWDAAKKDADALEKRLSGLIKRNRRLAGF